MPTELPHFEAPPINEVAMGVRFAPIEGLVLTHFGLFWSSLREEFSKSEEAAPLSTSEGLALTKAGLPLPRVWLIHDDDEYLIQLQPNIFHFNWRRQDEVQIYPRYSRIKQLFYDYLQRYVEFLTQEQLPQPEAVECDLTYVNIIPQGQNGNSSDGLVGLFPDVNWRLEEDRFLPVPKALNWQTTFDIDDAVELIAKVQSAKRASDDLPVLRFEINARDMRSKSPLDETEHWFDRAHEAIVLSFADLTSSKSQREIWKRIYDAN